MSLSVGMVYKGKITTAAIIEEYQRDNCLIAAFDIEVIDDEGEPQSIRAKHKLFDDYLDRSLEVLDHLGHHLGSIERIENTVGKEVNVWIGQYGENMYGRINAPRTGSSPLRQVDTSKIRRLQAEQGVEPDDNVPF